MVAMIATREDIDATVVDQRPNHKTPVAPHYYASDVRFLRATGKLCAIREISWA